MNIEKLDLVMLQIIMTLRRNMASEVCAYSEYYTLSNYHGESPLQPKANH